jgi:PDZ domain-containing protein
MPKGEAPMKKKLIRYAFQATALATVVYFISFYPLNLVASFPGGVDGTAKLVHVAEPPDRTTGHFYITSVGEFRKIPPIMYLYLKYYKQADFEKETDVYGKGETEKVEQVQGEYDMRGAQQNAIAAAYKVAKIDFKMVNQYLRIRYIYPDSHAVGKLKLNDRIIQLDSTPIRTYTDYAKYMLRQKQPVEVGVTVLRGKKQITTHVKLLNLTKKGERPVMGIGLDLVNEANARPKAADNRVTFEKIDAIGPSGGLMYALEIYNQLIKGDITKGRKIAGTGEIDAAGNVGPIGGVKYKVMGAKEKGAKIFLAPEWNAKEARKTAAKIGGIHVVSVKTIDDAIRYLTTTGD